MDTLYNKREVEAGINYLKLMQNGQTIRELVEGLDDGTTEEAVKRCIAAARAHKDAAHRPAKVTVAIPNVKVHRDLRTGSYQVVKSVHVELQKDIIVNYGEDSETEFFALLPVKISIKRV